MTNRVAVLDTDFIIKTFCTKNAKDVSLIETVLKLPYEFYCHEQNRKELGNNANGVLNCMENKIDAHIVKCLDDVDLLDLIHSTYGFSSLNSSVKIFADFLKESCDIFSSVFYTTYYDDLETLKNTIGKITKNDFENVLRFGDEKVGRGNNLGEIKCVLLSLILHNCKRIGVFNFCSDDIKTRRNLLTFTTESKFPLSSISFMGFFWVAKQKNLLIKAEELEYLSSWKNFCAQYRIGTNIKIKKNISRKQPDYSEIDIDVLFNAIWADEVVMTNDGFLVYKSELTN